MFFLVIKMKLLLQSNNLLPFFLLLASTSIPLFRSSFCPLSSLLCLLCLLLLSSFLSFTLSTPSTERPQPPRKLSVPQDGVESRRLRLHWQMGGSGSSPLRYFTLQVKELPSGDWKTHTADVLYNVTTWTVDRYACVHILTAPTATLTNTCICVVEWRRCAEWQFA